MFVELVVDGIDAEELDVCICSSRSCLQAYVARDTSVRPTTHIPLLVERAKDHDPDSGRWALQLVDASNFWELPEQDSYTFHVADQQSEQVWVHETRELSFSSTPYPEACQPTLSNSCRKVSVKLEGKRAEELDAPSNPCVPQLGEGARSEEVVTMEAPLSVDNDSVCAITADGLGVRCWFSDVLNEEVSVQRMTASVTSIDNLSTAVCGVSTEGEVHCAYDGRMWTEEQTGVTQLSLGHSSADDETRLCLVTFDGGLQCGSLDVETSIFLPDWKAEGEFSAVSVGRDYLCAIAADESVKCWDDNYEPTPAPAGRASYLEVEAYGHRACALGHDGLPVCWSSKWELLGWQGAYVWRSLPLPETGPLIQVSAEREHFCGLDPQGQAHCWNYEPADGPVDVAIPSDRFVRIGAGTSPGWGCGLTETSEVRCWGGLFGMRDLNAL